MKKINLNTIIIILIAAVLGLVGGFASYSFLGAGQSRVSFFGQVDLTDVDPNRAIFIDNPRNVTINQDLSVRRVENEVLPALVDIYLAKSSTNPLYQAYLPSESLGGGLVITADGWVITTDRVVRSLNSHYQAIGYQAKQHDLSGVLFDRPTGLVYAKMETNDLPVAKLGDSSKLTAGQSLLVVSARNNLNLAHIKRIGYRFSARQNLVQSSESLNKEIFLDLDLSQVDNGSVVVDLKGQVVGLVANGRVVLVDYFKNVISQVLKTQKINRPVLGVKYIDLAQVLGLSNLGDKGALVYGNLSQTSPASDKLLDGDIIKKVDDIELNVYLGLADLINTYQSGDSLELLVDRDGKELTVDIKLK